jgi:hypothetical protein
MIRIVKQGISTALIIEDDADWDIRLKSQLAQFAHGTRLLSQPLASRPGLYADPTFGSPNHPSDFERPIVEIDIERAPAVQKPQHSPYGDSWDLLWFGTCALRFPDPSKDQTQLGRVVIRDDPTVPQTQHISPGWGSDDLMRTYPNHTRVIHHTADNVCTLGYAITQRAARQMLYQFGIKELNAPIDIMMRKYCDGLEGFRTHNCYTASPQYFEHFRPRGKMSSISDINHSFDGWVDKDSSANIRFSTRGNLEKLTDGASPSELVDQYPDT